MSRYVINVQTDKDMGNAAFVRHLLFNWTQVIDRRLRPDRFDLGEPVKRNLMDEGFEAAVELWMANQMPVLLKRTRRPRYMVDMRWRPEKGLDSRPFPWGCTVWLANDAGDGLAKELLVFLIKHFEPGFAHLTSYKDEEAKHFAQVQDRTGLLEAYVGIDVGPTIPGVYWLTYFGKELVNRLGAARFARLPCHTESIGNGLLLTAYPSSATIGKSEGTQAEQTIRDILGYGHFFDKSTWDPNSLRPDDESRAIVEDAVAKRIRNR